MLSGRSHGGRFFASTDSCVSTLQHAAKLRLHEAPSLEESSLLSRRERAMPARPLPRPNQDRYFLPKENEPDRQEGIHSEGMTCRRLMERYRNTSHQAPFGREFSNTR